MIALKRENWSGNRANANLFVYGHIVSRQYVACNVLCFVTGREKFALDAFLLPERVRRQLGGVT
jgi:hypothetical protein